MRTIDVAPLPLSDLESHLDEVATRRLRGGARKAHGLLDGRTIWVVTPSASASSGVAETVAPLVGYARGLSLDARWLTLDAPAEFREIAERLHANIHGQDGDGGKLAEKQRDIYEHVLASNADNVIEDVREGDVVILEDPPTAGLARAFKRAGAKVVWRCHLGTDSPTEAAQIAWAFLDRYLEDVDLVIVSRPNYLPAFVEPDQAAVIPPSINPESPKNRVLDLDESWTVARLAGLFAGKPPFDAVPLLREDGRTDAFRGLEEQELVVVGGKVPEGARTITQVQRWDRLKGGLELVEAFAAQTEQLPANAHLLLVGPKPDPVKEPAAQAVLDQIIERVSTLPPHATSRIHVMGVSARDREVNATVVNAVQRVSDVVTQRSLVEAFGLTVAEAMWKKLPVVASAVGGIQDQIEDGVTGVLVQPSDAAEWGSAVADVLNLPERASELGLAAHEAVRREFLPDRHLLAVLEALEGLLE
ncbi:Trehalose synthase [Actinomyces bovis]|uniref:Trehalose synthase n=1 Tax=Actinomyces bovis TaxID=1658 RepID=A0ABY1VNP4_9ACTO|nr:glycosyltransferase [Actinomyces bovis]SPT53544.1 Trehalose synthase [Actinomyces bovis]VEG55509.1 Trehalose synthase [Actinomyces israelii]